MVNYQYVLKDIERNHEALVNQGAIAASKAVRGLLLTSESSKASSPPAEPDTPVMANPGPKPLNAGSTCRPA